MSTRSHFRHAGGDHGFALASTVFLGSIALLLLAIVIGRGISSSEVSSAQIDWEVALNVAEGELDAYLADLLTQADPDVVNTGHVIADLSDWTLVVSAAETLAAASPADVIDAPEGDVVILKPSDSAVVFAVGFVPDLATPGHKVRVVTAGYESNVSVISDYTVEHAVFGGGDLDITGSVDVVSSDPLVPADVHANGTLGSGAATRISGCGSESEDSGYNQPGCPASPITNLPTPIVEAIVYHDVSWYDLCPDGAHYGPAHPTTPGGTAGIPCSGALTSTPPGWTGGADTWTINNVITGVFFVSGGDVGGKPRPGSIATVIAHRTYGAGETPGTCGQGTGGSIDLKANSEITGHPDTGTPPLVLVADGDIEMTTSDIVGLIAAGEIFNAVGAGNSNIDGAIIASDNCDEGMTLNGNLTITFTGPFDTVFEYTETVGSGGFAISIRGEL